MPSNPIIYKGNRYKPVAYLNHEIGPGNKVIWVWISTKPQKTRPSITQEPRKDVIGNLTAVIDKLEADDRKKYKVYKVEGVDVRKKDQGKGYGKLMYQKAIELIHPHKAWLSQDFTGGTSPEAMRVWKSLKKIPSLECKKVPFQIGFSLYSNEMGSKNKKTWLCRKK